MPFQLMLAPQDVIDPEDVPVPALVSTKLDGIRCAIGRGGRTMTRSLKQVPNRFIRNFLETLPPGLDGELLLADDRAPMRKVGSAVMSHDGEPDFRYAAFDLFDRPRLTFAERLDELAKIVADLDSRVSWVRHVLCRTPEEVVAAHAANVAAGYEGSIARNPESPYRGGRRRLSQGIIWKLKQWDTLTATVTGWEPKYENLNEAVRDARGKLERSSHQDLQVALEELGALHCRFDDGATFKVGSGFTKQESIEWYARRKELAGVKVLVKFALPRPYGMPPRHPTFEGEVERDLLS